jgi:hypothetical protein
LWRFGCVGVNQPFVGSVGRGWFVFLLKLVPGRHVGRWLGFIDHHPATRISATASPDNSKPNHTGTDQTANTPTASAWFVEWIRQASTNSQAINQATKLCWQRWGGLKVKGVWVAVRRPNLAYAFM